MNTSYTVPLLIINPNTSTKSMVKTIILFKARLSDRAHEYCYGLNCVPSKSLW